MPATAGFRVPEFDMAIDVIIHPARGDGHEHGVIGVFGPGTVLSKAAVQLLEVMIDNLQS